MAGAAANIATSIATSSSSSPLLPLKKYDVFISFRGGDIRRKFLSHLRAAFLRELIEVFNDEETHKGNKVWDELAKAIKESRVVLVIFSRQYASSTWCLRELKTIIECMEKYEQIVIPVFYGIDPSEVRKQNGIYKDALDKHKNHDINASELKEWKECLTKAGYLAGWHSKNERDESKLVLQIEQDILLKLRNLYPRYLEGLVGITESYGHVKSFLENNSIEVQKIGIWGMPGIGKTTLANVAFFKLSSKFEGSCFLPNVREQSGRHGIDCLREKLVRKLLENVDLGTGSAGTSFVMSDFDFRRLRRKRVLIVLDDVDSLEQIDKLIGPPMGLGAGSRVIITSRDKNVLSDCDIIEITTLNSQQSLELFCLKAFRKVLPQRGYEMVAETAVSYANGNALALTVLGSMLYKQSPSECNKVLKKLQKLPLGQIQHVLQLSYDGLDEYQKKIFLDIACFWKGKDIEDLIQMLNDLYDIDFAKSEIKALVNKALVTISYRSNEVQMHDLIQKMGREVVRQENTENPECRSRLWDANDIYYILKNNKGSDAIKSISFDMSQCRHIDLSPDVFRRMPNVKYLKFYTSHWSNSCNFTVAADLDSLPNLRFLHWVGCPLKSLPSTSNPENLVELYMPGGQMKELWGGVQNLASLKSINLNSCKNLAKLPNLSQASKLETLDLSNCSNLVGISSWLRHLKELLDLNLEFCGKLKCLPENIDLPRLKKVNCRGCSSLEKFSLTSPKMVYLSLENTAIKTLPKEIWYSNHIETLILSSSTRFENLPEFPNHAYQQLWLRDLYLNETNIGSLPVSINVLRYLRYLNLKKCKRFGSVPKLPRFLRFFCATDCTLLQNVASSGTGLIGDRQALYYYNCTNLNQSSRNNIITDAFHRIRKIAVQPRQRYGQPWDASVSVCLPGKDIPDWFNIRKPKSSLSYRVVRRLVGFVLCLVLGEFQEQSYEEINVQCKLKWNKSGVQVSSSKFEEKYVEHSQDIPRGLSSDHVFIWYDLNFLPRDFVRIESVLSFEFYGPDGKSGLVKKCGIRPLYWDDVVSGSGATDLDDMAIEKDVSGSTLTRKGPGIRRKWKGKWSRGQW